MHITAKQTNCPVDAAEHDRNLQQWILGAFLLRANPLSVLPCRWSHSYCNRSDVRLCGSGRHCALHREDDTVSEENPPSSPVRHCHCLLELQSTRSHCPCPVSHQIFHSAPPWDSCGKQVVYLLPKLTQLHGRRLQRCFSDSCAPPPTEMFLSTDLKVMVVNWNPQKRGEIYDRLICATLVSAQTGTSVEAFQ